MRIATESGEKRLPKRSAPEESNERLIQCCDGGPMGNAILEFRLCERQ